MLLQEGTSMHWHATKCAIDSAGEQVLQQMKAELSWLLKQLSERQSTVEGEVWCAQMQFENAKRDWESSRVNMSEYGYESEFDLMDLMREAEREVDLHKGVLEDQEDITRAAIVVNEASLTLEALLDLAGMYSKPSS